MVVLNLVVLKNKELLIPMSVNVFKIMKKLVVFVYLIVNLKLGDQIQWEMLLINVYAKQIMKKIALFIVYRNVIMLVMRWEMLMMNVYANQVLKNMIPLV